MKFIFLSPRIALIGAGILLGLLARMVLGVPEVEKGPAREIDRPLQPRPERVINLPLVKPNARATHGREAERVSKAEGPTTEGAAEVETQVSGLVPPIRIPGYFYDADTAVAGKRDPAAVAADWVEFGHDPEAHFHPHGTQVCASGCAASHHPTETLSLDRYWSLLDEYKLEPMDQTNNALEALLYYGPQAKRFVEEHGVGNLDRSRAEFLWSELQCNQVKVSLRLVDRQGNVRSWLDPTVVPFDRRHVFDMQTRDLQPLVTSGTVKRVGLNHAWVRL